MATQTLQLFDETGVNPLPAGIQVSIYPAGASTFDATTLVGSAWTWPLGFCNVSVAPVTAYIAIFGGSFQAPSTPQLFTPDGDGALFSVSVSGYRSPSLSQVGYAQLQMAKLVKGWFGDTARQPGGIAYAIGAGYGATLAQLDDQSQGNLGRMRLQSSQGTDIDSWASDMLGPLFGRFPSESDAAYIRRCMLMVSRPRCTINAIQAFLEAFYASAIAGMVNMGQKLAFDVAGGFNESGAFNTDPPLSGVNPPIPALLVWDGMTKPDLATLFGVTASQFVLQIGNLVASLNQVLAFNTSGGFNVSGAFNIMPADQVLPTTSTSAPDPRLGQMINLLAKAGGTTPLYLVGQV